MESLPLRVRFNSPLFADRLGFFLGALAVMTIALVWLRTGMLPASSTGDEVWGSESAWWLLHEGHLRRDFHADGIGSADHDFLPPIPALGQALAFAIFGLSQFSMGVCSSIAFTGIAFFGFRLAKQFGLTSAESIMSAFSLAFLPASATQLLRVRYDVYVVLFLLIALWAFDFFDRGPAGGARLRRRLIAGAAAALAALSYFGSAPGLGLLFLLLIGRYCWRVKSLAPLIAFGAGAFPVFAAYGVYVLDDPALFLRQSLESAAAYAGEPMRFSMPMAVAIVVALIFAVRIGQLVIDSSARRGPIAGLFVPLALAAIGFWAMSLHFYPRYTLLATTLTSLSVTLLVAGRGQCKGFFRHFPRVALLICHAVSMAFLLGAVATAASQYRARNYQEAAVDLARSVNLDGLVLTESPGWLALRPVTGRGQLHHLLPAVGDPSDLNASLLLYRPESATDVSTVVVRAGNIGMFRARYPAVDAFMRRDDVVGPIEIAPGSIAYHMQAFVRKQP